MMVSELRNRLAYRINERRVKGIDRKNEHKISVLVRHIVTLTGEDPKITMKLGVQDAKTLHEMGYLPHISRNEEVTRTLKALLITVEKDPGVENGVHIYDSRFSVTIQQKEWDQMLNWNIDEILDAVFDRLQE